MSPIVEKPDGEHMTGLGQRMLDRHTQPSSDSVQNWISPRNFGYWTQIVQFIETNYPGVFAPNWQFGGKKHGWSLRFKKSKSFCTLIPERDRFIIQIVLGRAEREKTEILLPELSAHVREGYAEATTYHDGKWLGIIIDRDEIFEDVKRLLFIKRKPKPV